MDDSVEGRALHRARERRERREQVLEGDDRGPSDLHSPSPVRQRSAKQVATFHTHGRSTPGDFAVVAVRAAVGAVLGSGHGDLVGTVGLHELDVCYDSGGGVAYFVVELLAFGADTGYGVSGVVAGGRRGHLGAVRADGAGLAVGVRTALAGGAPVHLGAAARDAVPLRVGRALAGAVQGVSESVAVAGAGVFHRAAEHGVADEASLLLHQPARAADRVGRAASRTGAPARFPLLSGGAHAGVPRGRLSAVAQDPSPLPGESYAAGARLYVPHLRGGGVLDVARVQARQRGAHAAVRHPERVRRSDLLWRPPFLRRLVEQHQPGRVFPQVEPPGARLALHARLPATAAPRLRQGGGAVVRVPLQRRLPRAHTQHHFSASAHLPLRPDDTADSHDHGDERPATAQRQAPVDAAGGEHLVLVWHVSRASAAVSHILQGLLPGAREGVNRDRDRAASPRQEVRAPDAVPDSPPIAQR
eukprot:ctg_2373.g497